LIIEIHGLVGRDVADERRSRTQSANNASSRNVSPVA